MEKFYRCKICDQKFKEIPQDAVLLSGGRSGKLYRFPDGQLHDLVIQDPMVRHRWHVRKKTGYSDCELCKQDGADDSNQTEPKQEKPQSVSQKEATPTFDGKPEDNHPSGGSTVVNNLHHEEKEPEQSIEPEPPNTAMAYAFRNTNWSR